MAQKLRVVGAVRNPAPQPDSGRATEPSLLALVRRYGGPWHGASPALLATLSPHQRTVMGWPKPTDDYWTDANIRAVAKRYPGVDMSAYGAGRTARL